MQVSRIIDDTEIKEIEQDYNSFIQNQKLKIEEHLKRYDQI